MWFPARDEGSFSVKLITAEANSSNRSSKSNFRPPAPPSCNIQTSPVVSFKVRCSMFDVRCFPISFFFLTPARHELLRQAQMVQDPRDYGVHELLDGFGFRIKAGIRR